MAWFVPTAFLSQHTVLLLSACLALLACIQLSQQSPSIELPTQDPLHEAYPLLHKFYRHRLTHLWRLHAQAVGLSHAVASSIAGQGHSHAASSAARRALLPKAGQSRLLQQDPTPSGGTINSGTPDTTNTGRPDTTDTSTITARDGGAGTPAGTDSTPPQPTLQPEPQPTPQPESQTAPQTEPVAGMPRTEQQQQQQQEQEQQQLQSPTPSSLLPPSPLSTTNPTNQNPTYASPSPPPPSPPPPSPSATAPSTTSDTSNTATNPTSPTNSTTTGTTTSTTTSTTGGASAPAFDTTSNIGSSSNTDNSPSSSSTSTSTGSSTNPATSSSCGSACKSTPNSLDALQTGVLGSPKSGGGKPSSFIPIAIGGSVGGVVLLIVAVLLVWRYRKSAGDTTTMDMAVKGFVSGTTTMTPRSVVPDILSGSGMFEPGFTMIEVTNSLGDLHRALTKVVVHMQELMPGGLSSVALRPPMLPVACTSSVMVQRFSVRHRLLAWMQEHVWQQEGQYWPLNLLMDRTSTKIRKGKQYTEENFKNVLNFVQATPMENDNSAMLPVLEQVGLQLCKEMCLNKEATNVCMPAIVEMVREAVIVRLQVGSTHRNAVLTVSGCPRPDKGAWLTEFQDSHHNVFKEYPVDPDYQAVAIDPKLIVLFCATPGVKVVSKPGAKKSATEVLLRRMEDVIVLVLDPPKGGCRERDA